MIRLEIQYFNLNKILLLAIGLWPYQQSILTRFQFVFLSSILTASIIFQVRKKYNDVRLFLPINLIHVLQAVQFLY